MIDMTKQYTYNGNPIRIYSDGSDTWHSRIHGAFLNGSKWCVMQLDESELVEAWQPKKGELCFFWDHTQHGCHVRKFIKLTPQGYVDSCNTYWIHCAPFTGTLPEAFKGLV